MDKKQNKVFTYAQQVDGHLSGVSLELLGKAGELAREINSSVMAILPGHQVNDLAQELVKYGADTVIVIDDPALATYTTEPYTQAVAAVIDRFNPEIFLIGATAIGRDLGPRVAARVHTGLTADCTKLEIDEKTGDLHMTRPAFGGNLMATIICPEHRPQMATVRPGVMVRALADETKQGEIVAFDASLEKNNRYVTVDEVIRTVKKKIDIQNAKILVAGGRGVGAEKDFQLLEDLAQALGGEVAGSRAAVDAGWQDKDRQVGQTGKTVRPNLYFAIGISGAIQHIAGMEESDYIVAINKDADAPIFNIADAGIVGDLHKILPKLTQAVKAARMNG